MSEQRDDVVANVVFSVLDQIGVPKERQTADQEVQTLMLHEDASFTFIPRVEAALRIDVPASEWERVRTLGEVLGMLRQHLPERS